MLRLSPAEDELTQPMSTHRCDRLPQTVSGGSEPLLAGGRCGVGQGSCRPSGADYGNGADALACTYVLGWRLAARRRLSRHRCFRPTSTSSHAGLCCTTPCQTHHRLAENAKPLIDQSGSELCINKGCGGVTISSCGIFRSHASGTGSSNVFPVQTEQPRHKVSSDTSSRKCKRAEQGTPNEA